MAAAGLSLLSLSPNSLTASLSPQCVSPSAKSHPPLLSPYLTRLLSSPSPTLSTHRKLPPAPSRARRRPLFPPPFLHHNNSPSFHPPYLNSLPLCLPPERVVVLVLSLGASGRHERVSPAPSRRHNLPTLDRVSRTAPPSLPSQGLHAPEWSSAVHVAGGERWQRLLLERAIGRNGPNTRGTIISTSLLPSFCSGGFASTSSSIRTFPKRCSTSIGD